MNKVLLVGKVAYPPRFNETQYGAVLNVAVKITERYKKNDGEVVERYQTISAALWKQLAELNRNVDIGDLVSVEGSLRNRKVQSKSGEEHWEMSVTANGFQVLQQGQRSQKEEYAPDEAPPIPGDEFSDSDIPF